MAQAQYIPSPRTWSPGEVVKAPYLRSDVAGTYQLLSRPPAFIGSQTTAAQAVATGTDTAVQLDTETLDTLGGHLTTGSTNTTYYGMFPGWYLCEGTAALDYAAGSAGSFTCGFVAKQRGGITVRMGMKIPCEPGFFPVTSAAKVVQLVNTGHLGGASNDYVQLEVFQDTGGTQTLLNGTNRLPMLSVTWVAALAGTPGLTVPPLGTWPQPATALTAPVTAGGTSVTVASPAGMTWYQGLGGTLGIDEGTDSAETVTITAPPSGTVVPVTALQNAHGSGATVTVPVSAAFMNQNVRDACKFLIYPPVMEAQYLATGRNLASGTTVPAVGATVSLFSVTVDNYTAWNGSTTWTAPVPGLYYAYGQVAISSLTTTVNLGAGLTVTSANYAGGSQATLWGGTIAAYNVSGKQTVAIVRRMLRLNAGDTVSLAGFQNDSGSNAAGLLGTGDYCCRLITSWRAR